MLTRGAQVTGVAVCSLALTWISVTLRFYVRLCMLRFVGREDWLTVAAMIIFTLLCSLLLVLTTYGLGAHMHSIPPAWFPTGAKYTFICELLYVSCTAVTKLSIGVYFLRLASPNSPYQRHVINLNMLVVGAYSTIYFFFLLFQCSPVQYRWAHYLDVTISGHCLTSETLANATYAHAAMSALTDWVFGILPVFFVWKMEMNPKTKISVVLILSLGFFASTATIVRIVYIHALTLTEDYSWEGINLVKWSMVEPAIGITAANISTLRPLFQRVLNTPHHLPFFKSSRKLHSISDTDGENRDSADRPYATSRPTTHGCGSFGGWNDEFAGLLGLQPTGVTTHISAGNAEKQHPLARLRWAFGGRRGREELAEEEGGAWNGSGSQRDLKAESQSASDSGGAGGWDLGIVKTVVTTFDR